MKFRFLEDHYLAVGGGRMISAGTIASTEDVLPPGFVPTGGCEPLDAGAVSAFYRAGVQPCRIHPTQTPPTTH
jgi:hypothetical protein